MLDYWSSVLEFMIVLDRLEVMRCPSSRSIFIDFNRSRIAYELLPKCYHLRRAFDSEKMLNHGDLLVYPIFVLLCVIFFLLGTKRLSCCCFCLFHFLFTFSHFLLFVFSSFSPLF
jgi:hypothetical protein